MAVEPAHLRRHVQRGNRDAGHAQFDDAIVRATEAACAKDRPSPRSRIGTPACATCWGWDRSRREHPPSFRSGRSHAVVGWPRPPFSGIWGVDHQTTEVGRKRNGGFRGRNMEELTLRPPGTLGSYRTLADIP